MSDRDGDTVDPGLEQPIGLDEAYSIHTPEDSRRLYRRWATSYESGFATEQGYVNPQNVAQVFIETFGSEQGLLLDVGCGTGLVGLALCDLTESVIDGFDISPEMLNQAAQKIDRDGRSIYSDLIEGDLTGALEIPTGRYAGVLSAGTFTHGHVGPEALDELYRIARPGALFAIGIKPSHFDELGFSDRFERDVALGRITQPAIKLIEVYESGEHVDDTGIVAVFRRSAA